MKKKIIKIISLIVILILCTSLFCISVSAKSTYTNINDFINLVDSSLNLYKSSYGSFVNVTASQSLSEVGSDIYYSATSTESWGTGQRYRIVMTFELSSSMNTNSLYKGEFHIIGNPNKYNILLNSSAVYFTNFDGTNTHCSLALNSSNSSDLIVSFDSLSPKEPQLLKIYFDFSNIVPAVASSTVFDFSLMYLNFSFLNDSDVIVENQDKLSSDIQANADKNAADIKANQDKNANKILNGGKDNPSYSKADNSVTDDYKSKEDEVNNKTAEARSSTISFFNNFGSLLNDTPVQRGLLAVSKIATEFFSIGWLSGLIQFSLALGAFSFIIGSVIMVVGKASSNSERSERNNHKGAANYSRRKK